VQKMIISVVYPFLDHAARGDELRWSLRSLQNLKGCVVMPVIVGRAPEWYAGDRIAVTENGSRERDVQSKLLTACWTDYVTERFLVFSDDTVVSSEIDIKDLLTARHRGGGNYTDSDIARIGGSPWQESRKATLAECAARGWTTKDTSTHWPWCFEKQKLLQLASEVDLTSRNWLIEILYANRFQVSTEPAANDFAYVRGNKAQAYWEKTLQSRKAVNWSDAAFDGSLRAALLEHFPQPSPWEKTGQNAVIAEITGETVTLTNKACLHLGEVARFEFSPFNGKLMPVFQCSKHSECVLERINAGQTRRCITCPDRAMTSRVVQITRPAPKQAQEAAQSALGPSKAELSAAAEELFCVHRKEITYTIQAGSRPCIKRPVSVWGCELHGECSLRPESCLNGKVRACSTCSDLTSLVQINANQGAD
jgi:hypothetical protein